ncbi:MAG TPA: hypothetical protein VEI47_09120 [Gemmatimonadales bacterium]|nr:hypothetical protein [Gemmatimonadales bacterium]
MIVRRIQLPIRGFGAAPSQATLEVATLSTGERFRRGAMAPVFGFGVALLVLPIPIVHLAVPPFAIIGGMVMGVRRAFQKEIITSARGTCPFCGTEQTLGLNGSRYRLPRDLKCRSCSQLLSLEREG